MEKADTKNFNFCLKNGHRMGPHGKESYFSAMRTHAAFIFLLPSQLLPLPIFSIYLSFF
jgi:hypothetical protein